jgi:hypothetical protein
VTPQEQDTHEQRGHERLSTSDLVAARGPNGDAAPPANRAADEPNMPLFAQNEAADFRSRWEKTQIGFVDEPRKAVEQADELVANAIKRLAESFANKRQRLESDWDKNENVSTEDLRVALRRYRSFFDRLLSV